MINIEAEILKDQAGETRVEKEGAWSDARASPITILFAIALLEFVIQNFAEWTVKPDAF